VTRNKIIPGTS